MSAVLSHFVICAVNGIEFGIAGQPGLAEGSRNAPPLFYAPTSTGAALSVQADWSCLVDGYPRVSTILHGPCPVPYGPGDFAYASPRAPPPPFNEKHLTFALYSRLQDDGVFVQRLPKCA